MLQLARYYGEADGKIQERLMWTYLICWAFYEHWVEDWINAKDI